MFRVSSRSVPRLSPRPSPRPTIRRATAKRTYTTTGNYQNELEHLHHTNDFLKQKESDSYRRLNQSLDSLRSELERVKCENHLLLNENIQLKRENQTLRDRECEYVRRLTRSGDDIDSLKIQLNSATSLALLRL